jgi:chemotaxis protein MotB
MLVQRLTLVAIGSIALLACAGCLYVPRSQLSAVELRTNALAEQSKAQLAEIASLKAHARKLEDKLIHAEDELAAFEQRTGIDRRRLLAKGNVPRATLRGVADTPTRRLEALAERYPIVRIDPETGAAKLEADVLFESGESRLGTEARRELDELTRLLNSGDAREFRVLVVGHTDDRPIAGRETRQQFPDNWHLSAARALTVADYLQKQGLGEERVGVAGFGRHEPISDNATATDRQRNRRVEIFLLSPDTPVVGWLETTPQLYRR